MLTKSKLNDIIKAVMKNNFMFNHKFIDKFCNIFCAIYLIFVILIAASNVYTNTAIEKQIENMLLYANSVNKKIEEGKFFESTGGEGEISGTPLFDDGKTAIISAYNKTMSSKSFYAEATGNMSINTAGMMLKVGTNTTVIKYSDNKLYDNRANKLIESSAPGMLMGMINDLSNNGVKRLKQNGVITEITTKNVYFENNLPKADFTGATKSLNPDAPIIAESLYIINEDTIEEITYFKVKYKNGVPQEYYVQAKLDPEESTVNYKNIIKYGADLEDDPEFTDVTITVIIDAYGYVTNVTAIDKCSIVKIGMDCPMVMTQTYSISGFNKEMTFVDEDF